MKLSIIVPIYKVEKYIIECIKSIVVQLKPEYEVEIICVNDGTPDQSFEILRKYISELDINLGSKFLFIEQENKGLSEARNTGINIANGEYIAFIDSDDKIYPEYLEKILNLIDNENFDILDFNIKTSNNILISTQICDINAGQLEKVFKAGNWFAWARVYNKKIFLGYRFTNGIYYEDIDLIPLIYLKAENIIHINDTLYWYRFNPEGITQNLSYDNRIKTLNSLQKIHCKYKNIDDKENIYLQYMIFNTYFLLALYACRLFGLRKAIKLVVKYMDCVNLKKGQKIKFLLNKYQYFFILYPYIFLFIYRFYIFLKKFFYIFFK